MMDVGNFADYFVCTSGGRVRMEMTLSPSADTTSTAAAQAEERPELITPRRTRIDEGHPLRQVEPEAALDRELLEVAEEPADELVAAALGENLEMRREQLQLQVSQLAGHLRQRLRDVDRREAQLHAREANLEGESRAARLWIKEREAEFRNRETELRRRIEELEERLTPQAAEASESGGDNESSERELA